jgi:hypothetical protein
LLKYLLFWRPKRYFYIVFFSYTDGDQFETSWVTHSQSKQILSGSDVHEIQRQVEETVGFTHVHAKRDAFKTNVKFTALTFIGWKRI